MFGTCIQDAKSLDTMIQVEWRWTWNADSASTHSPVGADYMNILYKYATQT